MENDLPVEKIDNTQAKTSYAEKRKEIMSKFVIGEKDPNGHKISKIFSSSEEYVVYWMSDVPEHEALVVYIYTKIENDDEIIKCYSDIKDELDKVKFEIHRTGVDPSYYQRVAHAIPIALRKDPKKAIEVIQGIAKDVIEEYTNQQKGRLTYLLGAIGLSSLAVVAALFAYANINNWGSHNPVLALLFYAAAFSSFGGLLSISMKLKELNPERVLPCFMYPAYGSLRQLFSIICGLAVVILIKAELLFSIAGDNKYAILAFCFIAGFSETLIPNALRKIENKEA